MSPTACALGVDQRERDILLRPSIYGISALRPIYIHQGQRGMREQPSRIIVSGSANGAIINDSSGFLRASLRADEMELVGLGVEKQTSGYPHRAGVEKFDEAFRRGADRVEITEK